MAALPATAVAATFGDESTRALFLGVAAHAFTALNRPLSAAAGAMLITAGHRYGWPVAEGGSQAIVAALVAELDACGGRVHTDVRVTARSDIPHADLVLLDLTPAAAVRLYGDLMPARISRSFRRYRYGATAFKVDYVLDGAIPWSDPACAVAGTVHLGGDAAEVAAAERMRAAGELPRRPFVLVAQQNLADPGRAAGSHTPVWAYAHVPAGHIGDVTDAVTAQIERFAPGFGARIVSSSSRDAAALRAYDDNYVDGDIAGGANDGLQLLFRPRPALDPYSVGVDGVYLCSQSTPPGGGVHGMCGYHAARSALRYLASSRERGRNPSVGRPSVGRLSVGRDPGTGRRAR